MLTKDVLAQQSWASKLAPEELDSIATLSKNDEDQVIHDKTRDWHNRWDENILKATGIPKIPGEKSYDYHARTEELRKAAAEADSKLKTEFATLKAAKEKLEAQIAEGSGDAATKQQLADAKSELQKLRDQHKADLEAKDKAIAEKEQAVLAEKQETQFSKALAQMSLKSDEVYDAKVKEAYIKTAKAELLAEATLDIVDGKEVWRDKKGDIIRNPKNNQEPMTTAELLEPKLTPILDLGRKAKGAESKSPDGKNLPPSVRIDAKTQVEFTEKASQELAKLGIEQGTTAFTQKLGELRKEYNAQSLPMQ